MFYVGQRVVCVRDFGNSVKRRGIGERFPVVGNIYTVRSKKVCDEGLGLRLVEIINPIFDYEDAPRGEVIFADFAFRPVVETKTGMEIFHEILDRETHRDPIPVIKRDLVDDLAKGRE